MQTYLKRQTEGQQVYICTSSDACKGVQFPLLWQVLRRLSIQWIKPKHLCLQLCVIWHGLTKGN